MVSCWPLEPDSLRKIGFAMSLLVRELETPSNSTATRWEGSRVIDYAVTSLLGAWCLDTRWSDHKAVAVSFNWIRLAIGKFNRASAVSAPAWKVRRSLLLTLLGIGLGWLKFPLLLIRLRLVFPSLRTLRCV